MTGTFDLIFMDSDPGQYPSIIDTILDGKLLARNGVILIDNGKKEHAIYHRAISCIIIRCDPELTIQ